MKKLFLIILLLPLFLFSQESQKLEKMIIKGINYDRNLIVLNPFGPLGVGFSVKNVLINNQKAHVDLVSSLFEIDFRENNIKKLDSISVEIIFAEGSLPKIFNPECITDSNLEIIKPLDKLSQNINYALKDKSICIITGKIKFENNSKNVQECVFGWERLSQNNKNLGTIMGAPNEKGRYIGIVMYDDLYSIDLDLFPENKPTQIIYRFLIDLRGIPEDRKRGQLINLDILVKDNNDDRLYKLNEEFATQKLYYNSFHQSLMWDDDYANAVSRTSEVLVKQITQENSLKTVELDRQLKQLEIENNQKELKSIEIDRKLKQFEIEKNKSELLAKGLEINNQKNEIEKQSLDKKIKEKEIAEKSILINQEQKEKKYLYAILGIIILITVGTIYAFLRQQKLRKLIDSQKQEVVQQKHIIDEKHREITDSINYAERIQRSFLATKELLDDNLKDYFVFFQPKDIVSGDFYWANELKNGHFVLATADSTGHGVPGAIMSLLNTSSLERAIESGNTEPAEILNHTRKTIIERLKKDGSTEGGKDGMDCSLISFNANKNKLTYSAANNPIWIIRDSAMIELSPDKIPVGKHDRDSISFTQHEVEL